MIEQLSKEGSAAEVSKGYRFVTWEPRCHIKVYVMFLVPTSLHNICLCNFLCSLAR